MPFSMQYNSVVVSNSGKSSFLTAKTSRTIARVLCRLGIVTFLIGVVATAVIAVYIFPFIGAGILLVILAISLLITGYAFKKKARSLKVWEQIKENAQKNNMNTVSQNVSPPQVSTLPMTDYRQNTQSPSAPPLPMRGFNLNTETEAPPQMTSHNRPSRQSRTVSSSPPGYYNKTSRNGSSMNFHNTQSVASTSPQTRSYNSQRPDDAPSTRRYYKRQSPTDAPPSRRYYKRQSPIDDPPPMTHYKRQIPTAPPPPRYYHDRRSSEDEFDD